MNHYYYHLFGLNIESEIPILCYSYKKSCRDIKICFGNVPDKIDEAHISKGVNFKFSIRNEFWLYIKYVAHFFVRNGDEIIVEPFDNADLNTITSYLSSVVIGIALLQRKLLALHGSSVVMNNKCLVFTGVSGAGKSTMCNLLSNKGFKFLSDDISVLYTDKVGIPLVQPSYPYQRLCKDAATHIHDRTDVQYSEEEDGKLLCYMPNSFIDKPAPLTAIIELSPKQDCIINIKELAGTDKLKSFLDNIFCFAFLKQAGVDQKIFIDAYKIIKNTPYYRLEWPIGLYAPNQLTDLVMEIIRD